MKWTQSPRVEIRVGVEQKPYLFASKLLRLRSPYFQAAIDGQPGGEMLPILSLGDVGTPTNFENFYVWSLGKTPRIPEDMKQEEVEELAFFADKYQVFALQHQAVSMFDQKFASGVWKVQPCTVLRVYQECDSQSCLRRVFHAALKKLRPEWRDEEKREWSNLVCHGGELAMDLFETVVLVQNQRRAGYSYPLPMTKDACQFHDHSRQVLPTAIGPEKDAFGTMERECPFRDVECFPEEVTRGVPDEVIEDGHRVKSKKSKKDKKRPTWWDEAVADAVPLMAEEEQGMAGEVIMAEEPPITEEEPATVNMDLSEDIWEFPIKCKDKKKKKKMAAWKLSSSSVELPLVETDRPAEPIELERHTVVSQESGDDWVKAGEDKDS